MTSNTERNLLYVTCHSWSDWDDLFIFVDKRWITAIEEKPSRNKNYTSGKNPYYRHLYVSNTVMCCSNHQEHIYYFLIKIFYNSKNLWKIQLI